MRPGETCVLCHEPLPKPTVLAVRDATREHWASAHPDLFQSLIAYEDHARRRINFVVVPALLLWLAVLMVVVYLNDWHPPFGIVLVWFDVMAAIGFGGVATLIPPWQVFLRVMKAAPAKCRVCDVDTTVAQETEHVRLVHRAMYWRMQAVRVTLWVVIGAPFVLIFAGFHLFAFDLLTYGEFEILAFGAVLGFVAAIAGLGVWAFLVGPRTLERIRRTWKDRHPLAR